MTPPWMKHGLRIAGAAVLALALSGCIVYPYGPRYGAYRPYYHPYHYYY